MVNYKEYECESCGYTVTTNSRGKDMVMMEEIYSYNKRTVPLLQLGLFRHQEFHDASQVITKDVESTVSHPRRFGRMRRRC
jgi:hypothetical protein